MLLAALRSQPALMGGTTALVTLNLEETPEAEQPTHGVQSVNIVCS